MKFLRKIPPLQAGVVLALAVGIVLRLKGLTFQSFWNDELFSAWVSDPDRSLAEVIRLALDDVHPPFYQVVLWLWYSLFGYTEFAARFLSALLGAAGILAVFFLGKEFLNSRVGLYAAVITSLNPFHLYYSQEVRSYVLLFLLASLSYLFFLKILKGRPQGAWWLYLTATSLLLYSHYYGFYIVLSQGLSALLFVVFDQAGRRRIIVTFLRSGLILGLACAPLLPVLLAKATAGQTWIPKPGWTTWPSYFSGYFKNGIVIVIFSVLILISVLRLIPSGSKPRSPVLILWGWVLFALGLPFLQSLLFVPTLTARNTIIVLPAILVLVGVGLETVRPPLARTAVLSFAVVLSLVFLLFESAYYKTATKQPWREMVQEILKRDGPYYGLKGTSELWNVYLKQSGSAFRVGSETALRGRFAGRDVEKPKSFWLLDVRPGTRTDLPRQFGFVEIDRIEMRGVSAILYGNGVELTALDSLEMSQPYAISDGALVMAQGGFVAHVSPPLGPGAHTVLVVAKGTAAGGEAAKLRISVLQADDIETGLLAEKVISTTKEFDNHTLNFRLDKRSAVRVKAEFINDFYDQRTKEDRNIFFGGFSVR